MIPLPRVLLDCDPGIDDAFAILCALRHTELVAITTVSGNVPVDHTTRNARHVLGLAGRHVPVHRGAAEPLVVPAAFADRVHGAAGLGDAATPEPDQPEANDGAVEAILTITADAPTVVVATGPLTNVAAAMRVDAALASRIPRLHWMGGSTAAGNVTPAAEFNSWADPHAVAEVLGSGVPITMYGLNLTHQVRMGAAEVERLGAAATRTSTEAADWLAFYEAHGVRDGRGQAMHDPCALLGVTHPGLFRVEPANIVVHTDDEYRGRTSVQHNPPPPGTTIDVAVEAHAEPLIDLIVEAATDPSEQ